MNNWFEKLVKKYYADKFDYVNVLTKSNNVNDLNIGGNVVSAMVVFENTVNTCEIEFKEFTSGEKDKLYELLNKPINFYRLNNNILPDEFMNCGVKLYPKSLDDFNIKCSCGDEEILCSEAVHVLQVLSKMMMEDPFLIFRLKGFDFKKDESFPIHSIEDIFTNNFKSDKHTFPTRFQDVNAILLKKENFGKGLEAIYTDIFKVLNQDLIRLRYSDYEEYIKFRHFKMPRRGDMLELFKQKWDNPKNITFNIDSNYRLTPNGYIKHPRALFAYLMEMNQFDTSEFDDNLCFLFDVLRLTFELFEQYAVVPQIFRLDNGKVAVRWIPAFYDGNVLEVCRKYYMDCPDNLITYNGERISKENQVIIAVSLIVEGFIEFYGHRYGRHIFKRNFPDLLSQLFFETPFELISSTRVDLVNDVAWKLSVFEMNGLKFKYHLILADDDNGMFLELKVRDEEGLKDIGEADLEQLRYVKHIYDLLTKAGIENRLCEKIILTYDDYMKFKHDVRPLLKHVNVKLDAQFDINEVGLKLKLDLKIDKDSPFSLSDLDDYEWKVLIGDEEISIEEFYRVSSRLTSLVKINGKYYSVSKGKFNSFQSDIIFLPKNLESNEILQISLLERFRNIKFEGDSNLKELLNVSEIIDNPASLNGELRHYQKIGVSWLLQNIKSGFGSILADDMGLGKTVQVLSCILYLKENDQLNQQVLIIAPTTLLANWENEIMKFTPTLTYATYHGNDREFPDDDVDIVLTSFGLIRRDIRKFKSRDWFICVVDEAQNIKNPNTQQTKAVKSIRAFNRIALTGTPIENRLLDYWSIFDFTNTGYLFSRKRFNKDYVSEIERRSNDRALDKLKKITKPFILRRLKSDKEIISDLPEKHVNDIYCNLTEKQSRMYDEAIDDIFNEIKALKGIDRKGMILKLITHLKQICNHPSQYSKSKKAKSEESGKSELLMDILENILENNEKAIIFTQYVKMGEILEKLILKRFNREVLFLHGSLSRSARDDIVDSFQNDSAYPILIATLKTGGVGLNLTAAQNVIHYDLWWNPAVENQATDRVYRIGQKEDVMVYRLITKGTLEENIDLMIKNKLELAGKAIDSQETFITEMSDEELMELIYLR